MHGPPFHSLPSYVVSCSCVSKRSWPVQIFCHTARSQCGTLCLTSARVQMPTLIKEEEVAFNAQSAVLPLRRLATSAEQGAEGDALTGQPPSAHMTQCATLATYPSGVTMIQDGEVQDTLQRKVGMSAWPGTTPAPAKRAQSMQRAPECAQKRGGRRSKMT